MTPAPPTPGALTVALTARDRELLAAGLRFLRAACWPSATPDAAADARRAELLALHRKIDGRDPDSGRPAAPAHARKDSPR